MNSEQRLREAIRVQIERYRNRSRRAATLGLCSESYQLFVTDVDEAAEALEEILREADDEGVL